MTTSHVYDVIAFGAHPDDIEAVMGGTMERWEDKVALGIVDSHKDPPSNEDLPDNRVRSNR